jgi:hypothetical protein
MIMIIDMITHVDPVVIPAHAGDQRKVGHITGYFPAIWFYFPVLAVGFRGQPIREFARQVVGIASILAVVAGPDGENSRQTPVDPGILPFRGAPRRPLDRYPLRRIGRHTRSESSG